MASMTDKSRADFIRCMARLASESGAVDAPSPEDLAWLAAFDIERERANADAVEVEAAERSRRLRMSASGTMGW